VAAGNQADADSRLAVEDADTARYLAQVATADQRIANQAEAYYQQLEKEYEAEQHKAKSTKNTHKDAKGKSGCHGFLSCAAHCIDHAASCVTHTVTHAATTAVTSTVHAAVSCVTKLNAGACVQTAVTVVLVLGTGGEGAAAEAAIESALEAEGQAAAEAAGSDSAQTLFHYTNESGMKGILDSGQLNPSLKELNSRDAFYGNGQYLSDIEPGTMTSNQLSRAFLKVPWAGARFTHFVEIDVSGLDVIQGRAGVYLIRNEGPLDLTGRIVSSGSN
jgi:hypothetical protein